MDDFELYLPKHLKDAINAWERGVKNNSTLLDCFYTELYSSINSALYDNEITKEEAELLREKYLKMEVCSMDVDMNKEIDFTNEQINKFRMYSGANGKKIGIIYQGDNYMLKFPAKATRNPEIKYTNSSISEYIACHIFESLGIKTQTTLLGTYGDQVVVACKDFETDGYVLKDFLQLKNTIIENEDKGSETEISFVLDAIKKQNIIAPDKLEEFFWNMFIGDALLGNFDRHNGNWGFLINEKEQKVKIAPVFDCGSCLYPQNNDKTMKYILDHNEEMNARVDIFPTSSLKQDGVKINYGSFLMSTNNEACLRSLKNIGSRISLDTINGIVDTTPYISDVHKLFLKEMIKRRKRNIIDNALSRLNERPRPIERAFSKQPFETAYDIFCKSLSIHMYVKVVDHYQAEVYLDGNNISTALIEGLDAYLMEYCSEYVISINLLDDKRKLDEELFKDFMNTITYQITR